MVKESDEKWLSIIDYSLEKNKSISTIRRYIKDNRIEHKSINGKYFIKVKNANLPNIKSQKQSNEYVIEKLKNEIEILKKEYRLLKEENFENKMLINAYEQSFQKNI